MCIEILSGCDVPSAEEFMWNDFEDCVIIIIIKFGVQLGFEKKNAPMSPLGGVQRVDVGNGAHTTARHTT